MQKITIQSFENLSKTDLFYMLQLRCQIFVVEQNCPYLDIDSNDLVALHLLLKNNHQLIGTLRIIKKENEVKIGRVAIHKNFRKLGLGKLMMTQAHQKIKSTWGEILIRISAQQYLEDFYKNLGYSSTGKKYLEDNIPHLEMVLQG